MDKLDTAHAAASGAGLDIPAIIDKIGDAIYLALAVLAIWGVYNAILLYRNLRRKGLQTTLAASLNEQIRELCLGPRGPQVDAAVKVCQGPPWWHTALAQLIAVALTHRDEGVAKVKQALVLEFHTEVIAGMENRLATIGTIVRMGPLLGLLGTVASMIAAFGRIGGAEKANPGALAADISLALWATASGLLIATSLMLVGNDVHARLRRLRDHTERQLHDFLGTLEELDVRAGRPRSSGSVRTVL